MTRAEFGSALHRFNSVAREIARGMTDVGVGSGALFGETQTSPTAETKLIARLSKAKQLPSSDRGCDERRRREPRQRRGTSA